MLSDSTIRKLVETGKLVIKPYSEKHVGPCNLEIHLGDEFVVDGKKLKARSFELEPFQFILGHTVEWMEMPRDIAGIYDGTTTLARMGVSSHQSSLLIHPGFRGNLTLEIFNASNKRIVIKAGMEVGQVMFFRLDKPAEFPYGTRRGEYQGQKGATPPIFIGRPIKAR